MKLLNTTPGNGFLCPLFFRPMLIKPTYDKFYRIIYTRGKDQQTTDIVDATASQVEELVWCVIKGKTSCPKDKQGVVPSTNVQIWRYDTRQNQKHLCRTFLKVYNQSPRNIRMKVEHSVRSNSPLPL